MKKLKLDASIYTPVAQHYIARPEFYGLTDPLPRRSGFLKGESDQVILPDVPPRKFKVTTEQTRRKAGAPLTAATWEAIVEWAAENAPGVGERHSYWNAIAGFLYRNGVDPDDVSEIVYEGATTASDSEAYSRMDCALRACDAIARGHNMTGIPTLVEDFSVTGVDQIIEIMGVNRQSAEDIISALSPGSDSCDINKALSGLLTMDDIAREIHLNKIKDRTKLPMGALRNTLKTMERDLHAAMSSNDISDDISDVALGKFYSGGENIVRIDRQNFVYNGAKWEPEPEDYTAKNILIVAKDFQKNNPEMIQDLSKTLRDARFLAHVKTTTKGDPLRRQEEHQPVINTQNAEIWFNKDGSFDVLPHHRDSFQLVQIGVDYDPGAKIDIAKRAILEIFSGSSDPEDMYRHFFELVGNIIVPRRDFAAFSLWKGVSNCGKSKLLETLIRLVGQDSVLSIKLESLIDDRDAIGNLIGKLIVVDDDIEQGAVFPDGNIKRISESKHLTGERKYINKFSFYNSAFPLMIGNHWPVIKSADPSIERRALVIPFNRSFKVGIDDDRDLFPSIWGSRNEMSGLLNEAISGYQRLRARGGYQQPQDCINAYQEWVSGSAFVPKFLNEICEPNPDGVNQLWSEHHQYFKEWAVHHGAKNILGMASLRKVYESLGYKFGTTNGLDTVKGIKAPMLM